MFRSRLFDSQVFQFAAKKVLFFLPLFNFLSGCCYQLPEAPPPPKPPPPPPKPVTKQTTQTQLTIDLNASGAGPSLNITDVKIKEPLNPMISPPEFTHQTSDLNLDLAVDWQAFGLGELDSVPVLLTKINAVFPRSLARKGITEAKVALDIFIDEQGTVSLIAIKEMPYKELLDSINKIIRTSRFSIPTKNNQPVRARFIWPVEFKKL